MSEFTTLLDRIKKGQTSFDDDTWLTTMLLLLKISKWNKTDEEVLFMFIWGR